MHAEQALDLLIFIPRLLNIVLIIFNLQLLHNCTHVRGRVWGMAFQYVYTIFDDQISVTDISVSSDINDKPFLHVENLQSPLQAILKYIINVVNHYCSNLL